MFSFAAVPVRLPSSVQPPELIIAFAKSLVVRVPVLQGLTPSFEVCETNLLSLVGFPPVWRLVTDGKQYIEGRPEEGYR